MVTQTIEYFNTLDLETLASVEGGFSGKDCLKAYGSSMIAGTT